MTPFLKANQLYGKLKFCLLLLTLFSFTTQAFSQARDSKGKDFWLMFDANLGSPALTIFITSDVNTSGTVSVPGLAFSAPFTVTANTVTPVTIPTSAATHTNDVVDNKGIHVTSLQDVTVYGLNYITATADAYLGLPTDVLGTNYMVLTYRNSNIVNAVEMGIVGTVDGTTVTITPSAATLSHAAGIPYNITLNQGQTYELVNKNAAPADLTGTIITSTKPIGVMGASQCTNIPGGYTFCDHIVEMLPPTTTWGKKFGTVPLKSRSNGDTWRFMASENGTTVSVNGVAQLPILNRGQFIEKILTAQSVIESDKPILVAQYANGSSFSGNPGDPFMMLIPPLEQFLAKYTVTNVAGYVANFINVIAPNSIAGTLILDGAAVPAASFTPIGSTGFSGAQISVAVGTHNLSGPLPFGVFVYGFNTDDAYGYPGGQSFSEVATVKTVTLTPKTGTAPTGTEQCFDALVKDQFSHAVSGVRVDFGITGVNPGSSGFAFTNTSGIAHFCYTGVNPGTDNIKAAVGTINDNGSFVWTAVSSNVYYSKPAGDLHNVLTWGVNPDGSGANPPDFTAGKTFNLANRPGVYTMTADWTVGGIIHIASGSQLQINGHTLSEAALTGTGTLSGTTTSSLIVTGASGAGILNFTQGYGLLKNFTVRSGATATLGTPLDVYNILTIQSGTLNTGNLLTLKSTATTTAIVAPVIGDISGNAMVERFIPARRAWRMINAPVTSTQTIRAWQEGAINATDNPYPGYGTHITGGPIYGTAANGFDLHPGSESSLKYYDNVVNNWIAVHNTNATLVGNIPYMLFVRGDRHLVLDGPTLTPNNTVLRSNGSLLTGNKTYTVNATGFTAVPNPYLSPVNFATITKNNVQNNFYVWDPKLGGTYGRGAYVTVSWNGTSYDVTPAAVSPESQYIQPWQSFMVHSTGVSGSITFKESDKGGPVNNVYRTSGSTGSEVSGIAPANVALQDERSVQSFRVNLQVPDAGNASVLDEVLTTYSADYSNKVDDLDAEKMVNVNENLAILRGGHNLAIERRQEINASDTMFLQLSNISQGSYLLQFHPANFSPAKYAAYLEDQYLHTSTPIELGSTTQVAFAVNTDGASQRSDRFRIVFITGKASPVVTTNTGRGEVLAYPNPVSGKTVNVHLVNVPKGSYRLQIVNGVGQVILQKGIDHAGGSAIYMLQLPGKPAQGVYQLQVTNDTFKTNLKILIN